MVYLNYNYRRIDMKFEFNKEEFESLMKLVYWGNWMANANKSGDKIDKYEFVKNKVFLKADEVGLGDYISTKNGEIHVTQKFEEETDINEIHDEYDEDTFWGELADRLAMKEFMKTYSSEEIKLMSMEERVEKSREFFERYEEEIRDNGLDKIELVKGI